MGYWTIDTGVTFDDIDELCDYLFDPDNYEDDDAVREYIDDWDHDEYQRTLEEMEDEDEEWINNFKVTYHGDPDEDEDSSDEDSWNDHYYDEETEDTDEEEEIVIKSLIDHFQKLI